MSWKDEVIIPLIRMMTYNIYKTLSPKFLAHAVSLYPFVKNSIIFYSIHDALKIIILKKCYTAHPLYWAGLIIIFTLVS